MTRQLVSLVSAVLALLVGAIAVNGERLRDQPDKETDKSLHLHLIDHATCDGKIMTFLSSRF